MSIALQVRLTPALKREAAPAAMPVLDCRGPQASIGGARGEDDLVIPVQPDRSTLFGPRGACLMQDGSLWISDTGHHRLLGWAQTPEGDDIPADWLIGQPDFGREGRNAKGEPGANTLNVPTGICAVGAGMAVADAWNHRILIWRARPSACHTAADVVLGQGDFCSVEGNRGSPTASAESLFWPYGVHWDGRRLWVADTGNRRVLMWHGIPQENGCAADLVLGQADLDCRDENGGAAPSAGSMRWPHAIGTWCGRLCVTDAGNNRILVWKEPPTRHNAPSDWVLGQSDFAAADHNQSLYWPSAATLHMPYGLAAAGPWCISADTANSRLIAWHIEDCRSGAAARALTGQLEFNAKGDNAWRPAVRDSLSWPYGVSVQGGVGVIADSGNNRVMLWPLAPELLS
jgi:hypothetical protein